MKKQIVLVLALVASLMTACDNTDPSPVVTAHANPGTTLPPPPTPSTQTVIRSIYPSTGASGTSVAIFGENFGPTASYNYVTFDSQPAEITQVGYGVIGVRVPENLPNGDYTITINVEGQLATAPSLFTVTGAEY